MRKARTIARLAKVPGRQRFVVLAATVLLSVSVAGCTHGSGALSTTTSSSPPTLTTASPSPSSTTTTTTAGPPTCSTAVLTPQSAQGGAAAGTSYVTIDVTNGGPTTCSLDGRPMITLYGSSGAGGAGAGPKLAMTDVAGGPAPSPVTLAPKGVAEFLIVFDDVPVGGYGCLAVASIDIAPTTPTESLSLPVSFSPCGPSVEVYPFATPGSESP